MDYSLHRLRRLGRIGLLTGLLALADFPPVLRSWQAGDFVQSAIAQAPGGSVERPAVPAPQPPAPIVESTPQVPGQQRNRNTSWLWVLGGGIMVLMGFFLLRILTAKPKEMPTATEDESARVRRHQHRRGQGRTPASREEQLISETSRDEFMNAPMRQTAADTPEPKSDLSDTKS